jgi:hypothetical protein
MKTLLGLFLIEFQKMKRCTKALLLPMLFFLLACVIMLSLVPMNEDATSLFRIFLWILVSLSLKLSFGSFLHEDADQNLLNVLMAQQFSVSRLLLLKVLISTLIFSVLFILSFLSLVVLRLLTIQDVLMIPFFVGAVFVLQAGVELLTLKTTAARYLCFLLLLPLEIPLLILVISKSALTMMQLVETMGGFLMLSVGILVALCTVVFSKNKNACNF